MSKINLIYALLLVLNINFTFSQNFNIPGEVSSQGEFRQGFFSEKLNENFSFLRFKFSHNGEVINILDKENIIFKIGSKSNLYKTLNINGQIVPSIVIVNGKASLFKDIKYENYYMQNESLNSELRKLYDLETDKENNRNAGILMILFKDCSEVRALLNKRIQKKQNINEIIIKNLTEKYNSCSKYSEEFKLTDKEIREQEYLKPKGIFNLDIGGALFFNSFTDQLNDPASLPYEADNTGFGAFISFNFSPRHLQGYRDKLFYDISIGYNKTEDIKTETIELKRSLISVNISPTIYFLRSKKINPFLRFNFSINYIDFQLILNNSRISTDVEGTETDILLGFETGIQLFRQFELAILLQPKSTESYALFENLEFQHSYNTIALKASYIFNFKKK